MDWLAAYATGRIPRFTATYAAGCCRKTGEAISRQVRRALASVALDPSRLRRLGGCPRICATARICARSLQSGLRLLFQDARVMPCGAVALIIRMQVMPAAQRQVTPYGEQPKLGS